MAMLDTGRQFDEHTNALLRSCIGQVLVGYDAFVMFDNPVQIYKTARLDFGEFKLDITNSHETIVLGPENNEEQVAIMSVAPASDRALWCPSGKSITRKLVDAPIIDVLVAIDTVLLRKGSLRKNRFKYVQSVIFQTWDYKISFDRDIWEDEYLIARIGEAYPELMRDCEPDWAAEPPFSYEYEREVVSLTAQQNLFSE